jgi:hypothetical protein
MLPSFPSFSASATPRKARIGFLFELSALSAIGSAYLQHARSTLFPPPYINDGTALDFNLLLLASRPAAAVEIRWIEKQMTDKTHYASITCARLATTPLATRRRDSTGVSQGIKD